MTRHVRTPHRSLAQSLKAEGVPMSRPRPSICPDGQTFCANGVLDDMVRLTYSYWRGGYHGDRDFSVGSTASAEA